MFERPAPSQERPSTGPRARATKEAEAYLSLLGGVGRRPGRRAHAIELDAGDADVEQQAPKWVRLRTGGTAAQPPTAAARMMASDSEEEEYEAERVLAERRGGKELKVKWLGYPVSEATWEPAASCAGCEELVSEFRRQQKKEHSTAESKAEEAAAAAEVEVEEEEALPLARPGAVSAPHTDSEPSKWQVGQLVEARAQNSGARAGYEHCRIKLAQPDGRYTVRFTDEAFDQRNIVDILALGSSLGARRRRGPEGRVERGRRCTEPDRVKGAPTPAPIRGNLAQQALSPQAARAARATAADKRKALLSAKVAKAAQEAEVQEEGSEAAAAEEQEQESRRSHGPVARLHPKEALTDKRSGPSRGV
jgi:hypothetical protein